MNHEDRKLRQKIKDLAYKMYCEREDKKLNNDAWEHLSTLRQHWYNKAVKVLNEQIMRLGA
jgi:hypothetical protein